MRASLWIVLTMSLLGVLGSALPRVHVLPAAIQPGTKDSNGALTELKVRQVIPVTEAQRAVVLLTGKNDEILVPVIVGEAEGETLASQLEEHDPAEAASLLSKTVTGLGGKLVRVELASLDHDGETVHSKLILNQNGKSVAVDGGAATALSLAVTTGVPVMASKQVMQTLGVTREQVREMLVPPGGSGSQAQPQLPQPPSSDDNNAPPKSLEPDHSHSLQL
jgi:bifunctional DNase/RNase